MPTGKPTAVGANLVGALAVDLDPGDGFAGRNDTLDEFLDLLRDIRDHFANRSTEVIGGRNSTDFCQTLIDLQIPAIGCEKSEPYGGRFVYPLKLRRRYKGAITNLRDIQQNITINTCTRISRDSSAARRSLTLAHRSPGPVCATEKSANVGLVASENRSR
jgi:hypothetical protein